MGRPGIRVHELIELIVRHSGNPSLHQIWRRVTEKVVPYMWIETLYADDGAETLREHRRLCDLIRARKADEAEKLMRSHIGRARDNLLRVLALQVGGAATHDGGSTRWSEDG